MLAFQAIAIDEWDFMIMIKKKMKVTIFTINQIMIEFIINNLFMKKN